MTRIFQILKRVHRFESTHFPYVETLEDFRILIEIGRYLELGKTLTPNVLLLSGLGAPATIQRRLRRLVQAGAVAVVPSRDDRRTKFLVLSKSALVRFHVYHDLLRACAAFPGGLSEVRNALEHRRWLLSHNGGRGARTSVAEKVIQRAMHGKPRPSQARRGPVREPH